jgi:hypothetical protein
VFHLDAVGKKPELALTNPVVINVGAGDGHCDELSDILNSLIRNNMYTKIKKGNF